MQLKRDPVSTRPSGDAADSSRSASEKSALQSHDCNSAANEHNEREEPYRLLAEHSADIIFRFDLTSEQYTYVSPSAYRNLGYTEQEALTKKAPDLLTPESLSLQRARLRDAASERPFVPAIFEIEAYHKDGHTLPFEIHANFILDKAGSPVEVMGVARNISERKRWENALQESRERLDLAIKGTDAGLWDWNVQTGQALFDERWAAIIGYTLKELEPVSIQTWLDHCHPDDLGASEKELARHFAGETDSYRCDVRMRHRKGYWVWVLDRGKVVSWDKEGKPLRMVGTHVDITAVKLRDSVLQAERDMAALWSRVGSFRERLEVCLDAAIRASSMDAGGLYLVDESDGSLKLEVFRGLSEPFVQQARFYSGESFNAGLVRKGEAVFSRYSDLGPDRTDRIAEEGLRAIAVIPVQFQGRAIACLNLASHSIEDLDEQSRDATRKIAAYLGSFIVQEMLEERNRQAGKDLDTLFNTIQDMLFILDSRGNILSHNKAAADRLGYRENELIGMNVLSVHPTDRQMEVIDIVARMLAKELEFCHIPLVTKNGALIPVETKVILGHWKNQDAVYGICRDVSERLMLEQQSKEIEKAESLSRMAGSIAHNFNNMLSVVSGNLELAMIANRQGEEIFENLSEALKASRKAAELTQRMVTYLGQSNVKHGPLDLSANCRQVLAAFKKDFEGSAEFEIDFPDAGPVITGNAHQIHQLIRSLVVNAVESLDDRGGSIGVSILFEPASRIPQKRLPVGFRPIHTVYACMAVKDSGSGIPEKDLGKIFDPFFSTKFTGRGLGLSVALGIIREHEGAIAVESVPGRGSIFRVFLPLPDPK